MTPPRSRKVLVPAVVLAAGLLAACAPSGTEESAVRRGDEAYARQSLEEALAEYRLALRHGTDEPEVLARVGHTYVALGRVEEAAEFFTRAAARDARWGDMGVSDLVRLAREAARRNDRFQMAAAMEAARRLRPGLSAPDLTLSLARHYRQVGEYGRSIPLYQRALDESAGPSPEILFEFGEVQQEVGDCRSALVLFDRYRTLAPAGQQARADWNIGDCAFRLARDLRARSSGRTDLEEALRYVDRSIEVGEPRGVQGQAWYERGEILSALGDCDRALESLAQVRYYESGASSLTSRARQLTDRIQIGRGLVGIRGRCA